VIDRTAESWNFGAPAQTRKLAAGRTGAWNISAPPGAVMDPPGAAARRLGSSRPGESQDRNGPRLIGDRIIKLKRELEQVRAPGLHLRRARSAHPVVALVATPSRQIALFTASGRRSGPRSAFATLTDQRDRAALRPRCPVRHGRFISELPTQLVAAFRATLEEWRSGPDPAFRDNLPPDSEPSADVVAVLSDMGPTSK